MNNVLLVASTGGHLAELHRLQRQVAADGSCHWVTFDSEQSRSLLADESVTMLEAVSPRGYFQLARNLPGAVRIIRTQRPRRIVSTGSGIALAFLPLAPLFRAKAVYIESAARTGDPSFTGRLLSCLPWVEVHTQYADNRTRRWRHKWSVFDGFKAGSEPTPLVGTNPHVLVLLGTLKYPFDELVDSLQKHAPTGTTFVWQLGSTAPRDGLPGRSFAVTDDRTLREEAARATAIVSHAGVGSALVALSAGVRPILVPRRASRQEHVDDHQVLIAEHLERAGLATHVEIESLSGGRLAFDYRVIPAA